MENLNINNGILKTVSFLNENGFQTVDSGDGKTRDFECDLDIPYVHILIDNPDDLISESKRLVRLLNDNGIEVYQADEDGLSPSVEASYNPMDGFAIISIFNILI